MPAATGCSYRINSTANLTLTPPLVMMGINEVPRRIPVVRPKCGHGFRGWLGLEL